MADRLDIVLVNKGLASSREKAKALIKEGKVYINNIMQTKPALAVDEDIQIEIRGEVEKYVSRGGYKLEKAVNEFDFSLKGKVCMDIGASTGGFTDCMLKNGATKVYAIDVGHDQLHESLKNDNRVISMEGVNFRYLSRDDINNAADDSEVDIIPGVTADGNVVDIIPDVATCDVSFISLKLILPVAYDILRDDGEMICLIKPQFEAGKEYINKKGVVKDKKIHIKVLREILEFAENVGFTVVNLTYSPIKGPEGNIEYLMHIKKMSKDLEKGIYVGVANTVNEAFNG